MKKRNFVIKLDKMSNVSKIKKIVITFAVFLVWASTPLYSQPKAVNQGPKDNQEPKDEGIEYAKDSSTEINVKNADIAAVVRIFSKKTKRNYILDENVKGKVTIYLPGKVSAEEAIRILDSVLALKGFTSVPIGENLWKIVQSKEARTSTIPTMLDASEGKPSAAMVTRLLSLKFVNAEDIQQLVSQLVSPEGLINAYTGTNSLIIIDSEDNIERLSQIINSLDVASSDRDMTIVPITHADAVQLAEKLNEILGTSSSSSTGGNQGAQTGGAMDLISNRPVNTNLNPGSAGRPPVPGAPATSPASFVSSKTVSARAREPKIIPDDRTNSIIIIADDETTARVKALISQLDSEINLSGNRFYVYRCQHASADELANVLSGLVGGGNSGSSTGGSSISRGNEDSDDGGLFGRSRNNNSRNRGNRSGSTQDRLTGQQRTPGRSRSENSAGNSGPNSFSLGDNISITSDKSTNSLIIVAGKSEYEKILELLKQLDIKRRQVLVEALLLEVGIDDTTSLGTEFLASTGGSDGGILAKSDFGNLGNLLRDPTKLSNFSVAAASAGTLTLPGNITIPTQALLVSAAKQNSNVNVLSAPNILTTDNEQAEIIVGQNVPFLASQATSDTNLNNTFNQIDRQDVGITLRMTPQISSGDYVTLNIFTEVSNVVDTTVGSPLGPTTNVRTSETTIIAKNSQMIVIGGLMSDNNTEAESSVPFLGDVPVIGHLFRTELERTRRTNLLIFITPRIVQDQFDARDATIIKRELMEDVIAKEDSYPKHENVLRSPAIDNAIESKVNLNAPEPGTILAPQNKKTETETKKTTHSLQADSEGAIEFKVSPKLPSLKKESNESNNSSPNKAALNPMILEQNSDKVIIMSVEKITGDTSKLPFKLDNSQKNFALSISAGSSLNSRQFFQIGNQYTYSSDDVSITFSPSTIVYSAETLASTNPDLTDKIYTLSPYESMNIGEKPWQVLATE
jgi:general secretion pathway protein D